MSATTKSQMIVDALSEVDRWRAELSRRSGGGRAALRERADGLRAQIDGLQAELASTQAELDGLGVSMDDPERQANERAYRALYGILLEQSQRLTDRSERVVAARERRLARVESDLAQGEAAHLIREYKQFIEHVEPTLQGMPAGYREVVRAHHDQVVSQLRAHIGELLHSPITMDDELVEVEIVYAVDPPEGDAELLVCVLPVREEVFTEWEQAAESVDTWLTARVAQALYETLHAVGAPQLEPVFGGHQGLLAIETELPEGTFDVLGIFEERLHASLNDDTALPMAGVVVHPRHVCVDYLFPADEADDAE
jgi:hypothetical protein